ncbi:hypothetical protein IAI10_17875 [Clostridium sp. 19966]|uniref:hypothetical protein n=1 Tax=Clostridium sp. 19966 TaxID=2768166 RepID=UPI0028DE61A1|nr:hypothetical protein [Clostridium sp. 19966]MDT8718536.1 hypothetical protein [Clostridium sp. 19966]
MKLIRKKSLLLSIALAFIFILNFAVPTHASLVWRTTDSYHLYSYGYGDSSYQESKTFYCGSGALTYDIRIYDVNATSFCNTISIDLMDSNNQVVHHKYLYASDAHFDNNEKSWNWTLTSIPLSFGNYHVQVKTYFIDEDNPYAIDTMVISMHDGLL